MIVPWLIIDSIGFGACCGVIATIILSLRLCARGLTFDRWAVVALSVAVFLSVLCGVASDGLTIPDSAEYLAIARRLLFEHRFDLFVDGRDVPSRYLPWFSWFFLYPALRLGCPPHGLHWIVSFFAFTSVIASAVIAHHLVPKKQIPASIVGLIILALPAFNYFTGELMTDIPTTALVLTSLALFLATTAGTLPRFGFGVALLVGIIIATATSMRPLSVVVLTPWLFRTFTAPGKLTHKMMVSFALLAPSVLILAASGVVQYIQFGTPWRNGYQLWTSIPYDYPQLVLGSRYLLDNIKVVLQDAALPLVVAMVVVPLRQPLKGVGCDGQGVRDARTHLALGILPIGIFHLFYFYPTIRFFLPFECVCAVVACARVAIFIPRGALCAVIAVGIAISAIKVVGRYSFQVLAPTPTRQCDAVKECTQPNALILSNLHPMLVNELCLRGSERQGIPVSRKVELASKVLTWNRQPLPGGNVNQDPRDHRAAWLLAAKANSQSDLHDGSAHLDAQRAGVEEAYRRVALEDLDRIRSEVAAGRQVAIVRYGLSASDYAALVQGLGVSFIEGQTRCVGISVSR